MPDSWDFNNKPERPMQPIMTYVIIAICVVVTVASWTSTKPDGSLWYQIGHIGSRPVESLWAGNYTLLLSSIFLHASWPFGIAHLLFNMKWFQSLGTVMEESLSPLFYALFIITAGVVASGAEVAFSGHVGVGMSGVVYAMCGLMWVGRNKIAEWRPIVNQQVLNTFLIWGVFCVIGTWTNTMNIANAAHFGGLLFGMAVGYMFILKRNRPLWGSIIAGMSVMTVLAVVWMPWSGSWLFWKATREYERENYTSAINYWERSMSLGVQKSSTLFNISLCWAQIAQQAEQRKDKPTYDDALAKMALTKKQEEQAAKEEAAQIAREAAEEPEPVDSSSRRRQPVNP